VQGIEGKWPGADGVVTKSPEVDQRRGQTPPLEASVGRSEGCGLRPTACREREKSDRPSAIEVNGLAASLEAVGVEPPDPASRTSTRV
jgi:hypothetical protein